MRLWIGNLAYGTTEDELKDWLFEGGFPASEVSIIHDKNTQESRGFGFAEVDDERVVEHMNEQRLHGRRIVVKEATPREKDGNRQPRKGYRDQDNRHGNQF